MIESGRLTARIVSMEFRLLDEFRGLFEGHVYKHRASTLGDFVAMHLYEDLAMVGRSEKFIRAVDRRDRVLSVQNNRRGVRARRGDGTFGQLIPGKDAAVDDGYRVARGPIATVEIGVEVKILAKAMIKQIDRVINDLRNQPGQFRRGGGNPICVGVVGVNHANIYVGYEGSRAFPTTGRDGFLHPSQEAPEAGRRLMEMAAPAFDEFIILPFRATNQEPFPFEWVDYEDTKTNYAAALARISGEYEQRF